MSDAYYNSILEIKENDDGIGEFEGYASKFGEVDLGGDTIVKGAFKRTIANMKKQKRIIPFLNGHDQRDVMGGFHEIKEDDFGLFVRGQILPDLSEAAAKTYRLLKSGLSTALSIGYRVPEGGAEKKDGVRVIKDLDLYEVSYVGVGMDPFARVTDVKSLQDIRAKLANGDRLTEREWEGLFKDSLNLTNSEAERAVRVNLKTGGGDPRAKKTGNGKSLTTALHSLIT